LLHRVRRAHADLARLAGRYLLVVLAAQTHGTGGDGEAAGGEQLGTSGVVIAPAQHAHRIAFGLPIELAEHRAEPLQPLDQPRRRHRRGAVENELERGEIGAVERRMIEQHVDHGRHQQREVDPFALQRDEEALGIEAPHQMDRAALEQRGQHLRAGDMRDRRSREITRRFGQLEIRSHRQRHGGGPSGGDEWRLSTGRSCRRCS
jgi:hypothetical protein